MFNHIVCFPTHGSIEIDVRVGTTENKTKIKLNEEQRLFLKNWCLDIFSQHQAAIAQAVRQAAPISLADYTEVEASPAYTALDDDIPF